MDTNKYEINKLEGARAQELLGKIYGQCLREHQKRIEEKGYSATKEDITARDIIDASAFMDSDVIEDRYFGKLMAQKISYPSIVFNENECSLINTKGIKAFLPRVKKGVIDINDIRYITWKVKSVGEEDNPGCFVIRIEDYRDYKDIGWMMFAGADIRITPKGNGHIGAQYDTGANINSILSGPDEDMFSKVAEWMNAQTNDWSLTSAAVSDVWNACRESEAQEYEDLHIEENGLEYKNSDPQLFVLAMTFPRLMVKLNANF